MHRRIFHGNLNKLLNNCNSVKLAANALFYQGRSSPRRAREALITVAVESALLAAGDDFYKKVSDLLRDTYNCEIMDCNKHPQYLNAVLSKLGEDARSEITHEIRKELDEYSYIKTVALFLDALDS